MQSILSLSKSSLIWAAFGLLLPFVARGEFSIGAAPALLDIDSAPGQTEIRKVQIRNGGDVPLVVRASLSDWQITKENTKEFLPIGQSKKTMAQWITISPTSQAIAPGNTVEFDVSINTPSTAKGSHLAVIFFQTERDTKQQEDRQLVLSGRVGVLVMQRTTGHFETKLDIQNLSIAPPSDSHALTINWALLNSGNAHTMPLNEISILDKAGKLVTTLRETGFRAFPNVLRPYTVESAVMLQPGDYQMILSVQYDDQVISKTQKFKVGK